MNYVSEYRWDGSAREEDKEFLNPIAWQVASGTHYYQDGKYMLVEGDGDQPGWGSRVLPGYEKIGHVAPEWGETRDGESSNPDPKKKGPGMLMLRRQQVPVAPAAATPAPEVKPAEPKPVVKPFDPAEYSLRKPEEEPFKGYELNTKASSYEDWLARRETSGERDAGSWSGIGGDRVERTRRLLDQGVEQAGSSLTADGEGAVSTGGDRQRMAGSEAFRSRIDRYRQRS